jgi:hypothetical protein
MNKLWTVIAAAALLGGCVSSRTGVSHNEVPGPVLKTIQTAAPGKINTILREQQGGLTTYRAKVTSGGKDYDLAVAEDGTLVSKKER